MDKNTETSFVNKFVKKEYRDRLLFELCSKKHREKAISIFSHDSEIVLINNFVRTSVEEIKQQKLKSKNIYIISDDECDGIFMEFCNALDYLEKTYMAVILIGDEFVVVKEEIEGKKPVILFCNG